MTELNGIHADRVSAFSWALSSLFAGLAGVLIAPTFNTLGGAGLLQPRRGGDRRRRGRSAGQPAARAGRRARPRHLHRAVRHLPAAVVGRLLVPRADPGQPHAGDPVRRAVRRARVRRRASAGAARPPIRCRASTRHHRRWPPSPGPRTLTRATRIFAVVFFADRGLRRVHPGRRRLAVPRHPGGDPLHDLPLDHGDHRHGRADLAVPGRLRRHRAASPCSSSPIATTCRCWPARSSARASRPSSPRSCRSRCDGSAASGWPSPPSRSPTSSTRSW